MHCSLHSNNNLPSWTEFKVEKHDSSFLENRSGVFPLKLHSTCNCKHLENDCDCHIALKLPIESQVNRISMTFSNPEARFRALYKQLELISKRRNLHQDGNRLNIYRFFCIDLWSCSSPREAKPYELERLLCHLYSTRFLCFTG